MRSSIVKAFSLGMIAGSFLTAGVVFASPAKAEPDPEVIAYTVVYGQAVCTVLDDYPSISGILGIGQAIVEDGFTGYQAGQIVGLSVMEFCSRHTALMDRFASQYDGAMV